jgi:predicted amidohydrolase
LARKSFLNKSTFNLEKIKRYIWLAARKKADIVCFPESCVHKTKTLHFDDKFLKEIKEECKKNSIWCIITEDFILRGKPYSLAILINREGKITGASQKIHLYGDTKKLNPGKKSKVFETDFAKIGIVICWDVTFPELFKKMKKAGAEIVFCPAEWGYVRRAYKRTPKKEELRLLRSLVRSRAFENLFFVALCNPVEKREEEVISYSAICSPHRILKEIINKEGLITARLHLHEIKKFEKIYPR